MGPRLVLDTNCLIDLEEDRPDAEFLRTLVAANNDGRVQLAVAAISASENRRDGLPARNYLLFRNRLAALGLEHLPQLQPLATWDVGFWDHMLWSSDSLDAQARLVLSALFPGQAEGPSAGTDNDRKWRNRHCDAMLVWCCIHYRWFELITRDGNFRKRLPALSEFGMRGVWTPSEASELYAP